MILQHKSFFFRNRKSSGSVRLNARSLGLKNMFFSSSCKFKQFPGKHLGEKKNSSKSCIKVTSNSHFPVNNPSYTHSNFVSLYRNFEEFHQPLWYRGMLPNGAVPHLKVNDCFWVFLSLEDYVHRSRCGQRTLAVFRILISWIYIFFKLKFISFRKHIIAHS